MSINTTWIDPDEIIPEVSKARPFDEFLESDERKHCSFLELVRNDGIAPTLSRHPRMPGEPRRPGDSRKPHQKVRRSPGRWTQARRTPHSQWSAPPGVGHYDPIIEEVGNAGLPQEADKRAAKNMKPAAFSSNSDSQSVSRMSLTVLPVLDASAVASSPFVGQNQRLAGTKSSIGFGASQLSVVMGLSAEEMVAKAEEERKQNKQENKRLEKVKQQCDKWTRKKKKSSRSAAWASFHGVDREHIPNVRARNAAFIGQHEFVGCIATEPAGDSAPRHTAAHWNVTVPVPRVGRSRDGGNHFASENVNDTPFYYTVRKTPDTGIHSMAVARRVCRNDDSQRLRVHRITEDTPAPTTYSPARAHPGSMLTRRKPMMRLAPSRQRERQCDRFTNTAPRHHGTRFGGDAVKDLPSKGVDPPPPIWQHPAFHVSTPLFESNG